MNDAIAKNIRKHRELKGFSQEYMAHQLNVNQSTYAKMENSSTKITIDKLFSVAKLLETDVSDLLNEEKSTIYNQDLKDNAIGHQQIENLHQENKEVYQELLKAKDEQIALLKEMLDKK
jgi:transcriptional regulator with XRE-family HTH domain